MTMNRLGSSRSQVRKLRCGGFLIGQCRPQCDTIKIRITHLLSLDPQMYRDTIIMPFSRTQIAIRCRRKGA